MSPVPATTTRESPSAGPGLPRAAWLVLASALFVALAWQVWRVGVNQDVRQVVGVLRAAEAGGIGVVDAWAHRPLASRLVLAVVTTFLPADPVAADRVLRLLGSAIALATGAVLGHGLRGFVGSQRAALVAMAVTAALALAPAWDFAEPEWFAAAGAAAGVGVALALGRRWGPLAAGPVLAVVALLKYTTLTVALVAVACVWAFDRSRGRALAVVTAVSTGALFALTLLASPHEWQWLRDMPLLNPPVTAATALRVAEGWANHVLVSPLSLVGLAGVAHLATRRGPRPALAALAAMTALALPFVVQHQGFLYHLAPLPVLSAGLAALLITRRVPPSLVTIAVLGTMGGGAVFGAGPRTRDGLWWIGLVLTAVALALPWAVDRRDRWLPLGVAPLVLLPLVVTLSPRTAYSVSMAHDRVTPAVNRQQAVDARAVRSRVARVVPPDAPVLHLGFNTPWQLANPSTCRYVSPTFLQRANLRGVPASASFRENLACLDDPRARFAVIEKGWFDLDRVPGQVADPVRRNFPCPTPAYEDATLRICPRP